MSDPAVLLGLAVAAVAIGTQLFRYSTDPKARAEAAERGRRRSAETDEKIRAWKEQGQRKLRARLQRDAWFSSGPGKHLLSRETEIREVVRAPYHDAVEVDKAGRCYPFCRYGWSSAEANGSFEAAYDYISARGGWSLTLDGICVGGEFSDSIGGTTKIGPEFVLACPDGQGYLTERQRDVVLRLVGASGKIQSIRFIRHYDRRELCDRLWREHGPVADG